MEIPIKPTNSATYTFGEFHLGAKNLLLLRNSEVVPLAPKAAAVRLAFIEADGRLLTKQEILATVLGGYVCRGSEPDASHFSFAEGVGRR